MKGTGTHCCLVSEQLIPNIIPLLDLKTRPRQVELLIPGDMQSAARPILRLCRELGISVQQHAVSAWNSDVIRDVLHQLLSDYAKSPISLNVSGGFRLLALEAYKAFSDQGREIFFIDTRHDRRVMLFPELVQDALPNVLNIRSFLTAYGCTLGAHSKGYLNREERSLTEQLVGDLKKRGKSYCHLNWYAQEALAELRTEMASSHLRSMDFLELLQLFKAAGFLDWDSQMGTLYFPDEDSRFYANGGWLQQHVLCVLNKLRPAVDVGDLAANARVHDAGNLSSEVDVMFTARNRLFLIECRTKNADADTMAAGEAINTLQSLANALGGAYVKTMFISYRPLKRAHSNRCRQYGVQLVQGSEFDKLPSLLRQWIESA